MIAVDTNVLVCCLARDDRQQAGAARALLQSVTAGKPACACREVVVELVRVLERACGFSRDRISTIPEELVAAGGLVVEAAHDVTRAAFRYRAGGAGFPDLMALAAAGRVGEAPLCSFDRKAARLEAVELPG